MDKAQRALDWKIKDKGDRLLVTTKRDKDGKMAIDHVADYLATRILAVSSCAETF